MLGDEKYMLIHNDSLSHSPRLWAEKKRNLMVGLQWMNERCACMPSF